MSGEKKATHPCVNRNRTGGPPKRFLLLEVCATRGGQRLAFERAIGAWCGVVLTVQDAGVGG